MAVEWRSEWPCGCGLTKGLCGTHQPMVQAVYDRVWRARGVSATVFEAVWAHSDGYGEPGHLPPQGYDWSGIRDSTPAAIERMHEALMALETKGVS